MYVQKLISIVGYFHVIMMLTLCNFLQPFCSHNSQIWQHRPSDCTYAWDFEILAEIFYSFSYILPTKMTKNIWVIWSIEVAGFSKMPNPNSGQWTDDSKKDDRQTLPCGRNSKLWSFHTTQLSVANFEQKASKNDNID